MENASPLELMKLEELRMARANHLVQVIGVIHVFTGGACELELFLQRMDTVHAQIFQHQLDEITLKSILTYFYSRIDIAIMLELGPTFETDWAKAKQALKERYGSARS